MSTDDPRRSHDVACLPLLQVSQHSQREARRQDVSKHVHGREPGQDAQERLLSLSDFAGHTRKLLVPGIIPHGQRKAFAKDSAEGSLWRNDRNKWVVMPLK